MQLIFSVQFTGGRFWVAFTSDHGVVNKIITEHHKRKTESSAKDKVESKSDETKSTKEKTESTESVTVSETKPENEPEVVGKKKPEREFEEPKDETAKEEAA